MRYSTYLQQLSWFLAVFLLSRSVLQKGAAVWHWEWPPFVSTTTRCLCLLRQIYSKVNIIAYLLLLVMWIWLGLSWILMQVIYWSVSRFIPQVRTCTKPNDEHLAHVSLVNETDFEIFLWSPCFSRDSMVDIGKSCHDYYYKCVARKAKFASALQSPSKVKLLSVKPFIT